MTPDTIRNSFPPRLRKLYDAELRRWTHYYNKLRKDDDRRLDVSALTDEQLDRLKDTLDDEVT
jgi:hypothetical protein